MPLQAGTTLGPYTVTDKIGEGGMGEVWQARDTKLDRDVALKVLPEAFTSDPDRLARFECEAGVQLPLQVRSHATAMAAALVVVTLLPPDSGSHESSRGWRSGIRQFR